MQFGNDLIGKLMPKAVDLTGITEVQPRGWAPSFRGSRQREKRRMPVSMFPRSFPA